MSFKYSVLEARLHVWYFVNNSLGIIVAQLFILNNLSVFHQDASFYMDWRLGYYYGWMAQATSALVYLLTKNNEDCFTCFNRLAPQTYSILSFSE